MMRRVALLMALGALSISAQYVYDSYDAWVSGFSNRWNQNGSPGVTNYYPNYPASYPVQYFMTFQGAGGSFISTTPFQPQTPTTMR